MITEAAFPALTFFPSPSISIQSSYGQLQVQKNQQQNQPTTTTTTLTQSNASSGRELSPQERHQQLVEQHQLQQQQPQ